MDVTSECLHTVVSIQVYHSLFTIIRSADSQVLVRASFLNRCILKLPVWNVCYSGHRPMAVRITAAVINAVPCSACTPGHSDLYLVLQTQGHGVRPRQADGN